MDSAHRRLEQTLKILRSDGTPESHDLLILPDDAKVSIRPSKESTTIAVNGLDILRYRRQSRRLALVLSAFGTPHERDNHLPKYEVLELDAAEKSSSISIPDFWASVYALWILFHEQEHIPIQLSTTVPNHSEIVDYILLSGLGRRALDPTVTEIFLDRETFWQGAGTGTLWKNDRGWLREPYGSKAAFFPSTPSFTRTPLVISQHPLRPPKPTPGSCVYKRYCVPVRKMLAFTVIDVDNEKHMTAFHNWHNDDVVNKAWGEKGTMEYHRSYIEKINTEKNVIPIIMSWDDDLMGYLEIVWVKENHLAAYVPGGAHDYDRGPHVLVGESKYRGGEFSQAWFRSMLHYMFLSDPRTERIIAEPKASNTSVMKLIFNSGMHKETIFDFPYKRSALTILPRAGFFVDDKLL